jgi:hypothetical protein
MSREAWPVREPGFDYAAVTAARKKGASDVNEERVKQLLIATARKLIYDAFSFTGDFDNADAFEDLLADSFGGHARFIVTDLEVWEGESGLKGHLRGPAEYTVTYFRASDGRTILEAHFDLDCELDEYAKADLAALGMGVRGHLLPDDASRRTVRHEADGSLYVVDHLRGADRRRSFIIFPDGHAIGAHGE